MRIETPDWRAVASIALLFVFLGALVFLNRKTGSPGQLPSGVTFDKPVVYDAPVKIGDEGTLMKTSELLRRARELQGLSPEAAHLLAELANRLEQALDRLREVRGWARAMCDADCTGGFRERGLHMPNCPARDLGVDDEDWPE